MTEPEPVQIADCAGQIVNALGHGGLLFNTKANGRVNTMTIGWGAIGINWAKPVFTAYIREGRFTRQLLDANPEFTISVPDENTSKKILGYCGSHSGRDGDKIQELGLTLVDAQKVSVPAIAEAPLTLECKVLYMQPQVIADLAQAEQKWYPQDVPSTATGSNKDAHITVYGEIVAAYRL